MVEDKYKIHSFYILFILIAIIIILLAIKWGQIPGLVEYINFALTLTSLVLAILAIIYAFYSHSSFGQNITALSNLSREVSETAKELSKATQELSLKIETIPTKLETMEGKVDQTNLLLREFSAVQEQQPATEKEKRAVAEIVVSFIEGMSTTGILILYGCSLALSRRVSFSVKEFQKAIGFTSEGYIYGLLAASYSAGLINYTESAEYIRMTDMNSVLKDNLQSEIYKRVADADNMDTSEYKALTKEHYKHWIRTRVDLIEKFISELKEETT